MKKHAQLLIVLICIAITLFGCSEAPYIGAVTPESNSVNITETTHSDSSGAEVLTPESSEPAAVLPPDSSFEIHFLDVGQADAALILCDGAAMVIDGGNSEDSSFNYAYLKSLGIDSLETVVSTHAHEDHVGGLSGFLSYASAGTVYSPVTEFDSKAFRNFTKKVADHGIDITIPSPGHTFYLGSAECTVIGPISESDDPNNTSIVLRIVYGNTSFLFTGDAEVIEENEILDAGYTVDCDVLKVGHHGSETSTGYRWLRESSPSYAVISVGRDNSYGHPHESTLSRLRDAEVTVFRTDMQGTVICASDGQTVSFRTEHDPEDDTLAEAGACSNPVAEIVPEEITSVTFVVNTNTGKFHDPTCASVTEMAHKNRMDVSSTRDDLISQGYEPCGRCKP